MAVRKTETTTKSKTTPAKKEVKTAEKTSEVKTEIKAEAEDVKEPVKRTTRRAGTKAAAAKAEGAKKETVKKETVKREAKKVNAKSEVKGTVHFEFGGKTYTPEDLLKICKDVWKYDLNGKEEDFKSVELYVKPEENVTYYVINGDCKGSFNI